MGEKPAYRNGRNGNVFPLNGAYMLSCGGNSAYFPNNLPNMLSTAIGLTAATLTTISFLPQVIKTWKSKSAKDLSLGMFLVFCIGTLLWLIYGILVKDIPVITANAVTLVLSSILVYFKFRYKN
jgi:MtN3 and saliva related transmembrane protein